MATRMRCMCRDSAGRVCGELITEQQHQEDGMCEVCAGHMWNELTCKTGVYRWKHREPVFDDVEQVH